jgi:hypothetical protein
MSTTTSTARWWENYLVRYLMPSIAGVAIIQWLINVDSNLYSLLFFGASQKDLSTAKLFLLVLYGNLFCYVASYPILGFHVTRVLDFPNDRQSVQLPSSYWGTGIFAAAVAMSALCLARPGYLVVPIVLSIIFSLFQIFRIYQSLAQMPYTGNTQVFDYLWQLSKRRGVPEKEKKQAATVESDEITKSIRTRAEFIESYRHLREHGNSAFIFVLELILACLCYCIVRSTSDALTSLACIGFVFCVWSTPAVFVHLMGQKLEREFSKFQD